MTTKAKDGRETLQERLRKRADLYQPNGNPLYYFYGDADLDREAADALDAAQAAPDGWRTDIQNAPKEGFFLIRKYDEHYKTQVVSTGYFERETANAYIDGYEGAWWELCDAVKGESLMIDGPLEDCGYEWKPLISTPASAPDNFEDRLKELFGCEIIAGANTIGDLRKLTAKIVALHFEALASTPAPASATVREAPIVKVRGEPRDITEFTPIPPDSLWQPEDPQ